MSRMLCKGCGTELNPGSNFCLECGLPVQAPAHTPRNLEVQAMPHSYTLVLIRGDGGHTASYVLGARQQLAGREEGEIPFPDDTTVSARHASFFYKDSRLMVRDEDSANGTFVRVTIPVQLKNGDRFFAGEQLFLYEDGQTVESIPDHEGTFFFGTPISHWYFRITQILEGGKPGSVICARKARITIGREGADFSFPDDKFMSHKHVAVEFKDSAVWLSDLESRNGTFLRIRQGEERVLNEGDYIFIGRQLLKVVL